MQGTSQVCHDCRPAHLGGVKRVLHFFERLRPAAAAAAATARLSRQREAHGPALLATRMQAREAKLTEELLLDRHRCIIPPPTPPACEARC